MAIKPNKTPNKKNREEAIRALAMIRPRLEALEEGAIMIPNVSVPRAAAVALAAEPRIKKLRKQIQEELPAFDIQLVDDLRPIALATWHLHVAPRPEAGEDRVKMLVAESAPLKRTLMLQAEALADRKLLAAEQVAAIRAGRGNLDLANDLVALSQLFQGNWERIEGKVAIVEDDLERAAELGTSLLEALGQRTVATDEESERDRATDARFRGFTLLVHTYDEIRGAISYLRRKEGDADEIAPSLYAARPRRRAAEEPLAPEADPAAPPSPPETPIA